MLIRAAYHESVQLGNELKKRILGDSGKEGGEGAGEDEDEDENGQYDAAAAKKDLQSVILGFILVHRFYS